MHIGVRSKSSTASALNSGPPPPRCQCRSRQQRQHAVAPVHCLHYLKWFWWQVGQVAYMVHNDAYSTYCATSLATLLVASSRKEAGILMHGQMVHLQPFGSCPELASWQMNNLDSQCILRNPQHWMLSFGCCTVDFFGCLSQLCHVYDMLSVKYLCMKYRFA